MVQINETTQHTPLKTVEVKTPHYYVELLGRGATVKQLKTPNRDGVFENIILTYHDWHDYVDNKKLLGATVGPYAGRIAPAHHPLIKNVSSLDVLLHSGSDNLAHYDFDVSIQNNRVIFTIDVSNSFTIFPKNYRFNVIYTFAVNGFTITLESHAFEAGLSNLTNHMYFNLSGSMQRAIYAHRLTIPASKVYALTDAGIPKGMIDVTDTPYDFRQEKPLYKALEKLASTPQGGLDHPFILDEGAITLSDSSSGRSMRIETDYDALVVFTNNEATDATLEGGYADQRHIALCLEPQHVPNDVQVLDNPKSLMQANTVKCQTITYRFATI